MHPKLILDQYGLAPKQSLGQNFLHDEGLLARIAAAAELAPEDEVLEIGPGLGALTWQLCRLARRVVAVELDGRLLPVLERQLAGCANVEIVHADILSLDPADWFAAPYAVVANVPYYITGAILRHLLESRPRPRRLVLTVQREVADRLTARPPDMSLLAVSVQYYGRVRLVGAVKAGAFWPRPDVDSAVVRIDVEEQGGGGAGEQGGMAGPDEAAFFRVVRAGFSEKRKQLKNNLRQLGLGDEAIAAALAAAGIDGRRRAETLAVEEWERLVGKLSNR
jgi:16S rRNA (adenine1518-N6/adenine1519-N6)-dimethyltransferase